MLLALVPEVMTKASTSDVRMRSSEKKFHLNIWNTTSNTLKKIQQRGQIHNPC
jgi:hypothetical protein